MMKKKPKARPEVVPSLRKSIDQVDAVNSQLRKKGFTKGTKVTKKPG